MMSCKKLITLAKDSIFKITAAKWEKLPLIVWRALFVFIDWWIASATLKNSIKRGIRESRVESGKSHDEYKIPVFPHLRFSYSCVVGIPLPQPLDWLSSKRKKANQFYRESRDDSLLCVDSRAAAAVNDIINLLMTITRNCCALVLMSHFIHLKSSPLLNSCCRGDVSVYHVFST